MYVHDVPWSYHNRIDPRLYMFKPTGDLIIKDIMILSSFFSVTTRKMDFNQDIVSLKIKEKSGGMRYIVLLKIKIWIIS